MRTENKDKELNHRHFIGLRLTDKTLKGYCFMSCKTVYVMISSFPSEEEKMIVAAHELGRIILHRSQLKMAPMQDDTLYNMTDNTEYQANLFAADLLIEDEEIEDMVQNEDLDYFGHLVRRLLNRVHAVHAFAQLARIEVVHDLGQQLRGLACVVRAAAESVEVERVFLSRHDGWIPF